MTLHRKIGGIHWFALGRLRIAFCLKHKNPSGLSDDLIRETIAFQRQADKERRSLESDIRHHVLKTYCRDEHNCTMIHVPITSLERPYFNRYRGVS